MTSDNYLTLPAAAKKYWRNFLPAWLWPIWFFVGGIFLGNIIGSKVVFILAAIFAFFGAGYSYKAVYGNDIKQKQIQFLIIFGPILVWVLLLIIFFVFGMLSLAIFPQLK